MIVNPQVPLHRLILSLSEALDHVHPQIAQHQQRVAYMATNLARHMGVPEEALVDIFLAAALHDIGLTSPQNRIRGIHLGQLESVAWHGELGYTLLKDNPLFARAAQILRHHHLPWEDGRGAEWNGQEVPLASHIVELADVVEVSLDRKRPALEQVVSITQRIASRSGKVLHPECVEAFLDLAQPESFWLDVTSKRIYSILLRQIDWPILDIDEVALSQIAETFARIVDASSKWTGVHTSGVAAGAVALAERMGFSRREQQQMRTAGYLHDLGKLAVPTEILDKPGKLTQDEMLVIKMHTYYTFDILNTIGGMSQIAEWAAFHHERLDGTGYPFRHRGDDLTLGSRIMAVADVFSALAEERPYHEAMPREKTRRILDKLVANGGLDGDIVATLRRDYDAIDQIRREEQTAYFRKQKELFRVIEATGVPSEREPEALSPSHIPSAGGTGFSTVVPVESADV